MGALDNLIQTGSLGGGTSSSPSPTPIQGGSALDALINGSPLPKAQSPALSTATPPSAIQPNALGGYGASPDKDISGQPFLTRPGKIPATYTTPEQTVPMEDRSRLAVPFDPTKPQKLTQGMFENNRMPQSVSSKIKAELGGNYSDELDHRIAIALAGSNDKSNLQISPGRKGGTAATDDTLETRLAKEVVNGDKSLVDAQFEIAHAKGSTIPERAKPGILERFQNFVLKNTPPRVLQSAANIQTGGKISQNSAEFNATPKFGNSPSGVQQKQNFSAESPAPITPKVPGAQATTPSQLANIQTGSVIGPANPNSIRKPELESKADNANISIINPLRFIPGMPKVINSSMPKSLDVLSGKAEESPKNTTEFLTKTIGDFVGGFLNPGGIIKFVAEFPERLINDVKDTGKVIAHAGSTDIATYKTRNSEASVPSYVDNMVDFYKASKAMGNDETTSRAAAALYGFSAGALDVGISGKGIQGLSEKVSAKTLQDGETLAAWERLNRPKTMAEAEANYKALQHEVHPDKPGGSEALSARTNAAIATLRENGVPSNPKLIFNRFARAMNEPLGDFKKIMSGEDAPVGNKTTAGLLGPGGASPETEAAPKGALEKLITEKEIPANPPAEVYRSAPTEEAGMVESIKGTDLGQGNKSAKLELPKGEVSVPVAVQALRTAGYTLDEVKQIVNPLHVNDESGVISKTFQSEAVLRNAEALDTGKNPATQSGNKETAIAEPAKAEVKAKDNPAIELPAKSGNPATTPLSPTEKITPPPREKPIKAIPTAGEGSATQSLESKMAKDYSGFKKYNYEAVNLPVGKVKEREIVDLSSDKFKEIKKAVSRGDRTPIVVDQSDFILDGHHRFNAYKESGANYGIVPALRVIGEGTGKIRQRNPAKESGKEIAELKRQTERRVAVPKEIEVKTQELRKSYSSATDINSALHELIAELEIAEPGYRYSTPAPSDVPGDREYYAVPSTFPSWLPERLRSTELFGKVMDGLRTSGDIQYPTDPRATKQRELYNEILDRIDRATGIDTSETRKAIMSLYEEKSNLGNPRGEIKAPPEIDRGNGRAEENGRGRQKEPPKLGGKETEAISVRDGASNYYSENTAPIFPSGEGTGVLSGRSAIQSDSGANGVESIDSSALKTGGGNNNVGVSEGEARPVGADKSLSPKTADISGLSLQFKEKGAIRFPNEKITSPADVAFAFKKLRQNATESFYVVGTKGGIPVSVELISMGDVNSSPVSPYEISPVLSHVDADGAYLVHNHPSGIVDPSESDIVVTQKIKQSLADLGIALKGHVIIDTTEYGFVTPAGNKSTVSLPEELWTNEGNTPKFEKYTEWTGDKSTLALNGSKDAVELMKGLTYNWDKNSLMIYTDQHNQVRMIDVGPKDQFELKDIVKKATGSRSTEIILGNVDLGADGSMKIRELNRALSNHGIKIKDAIQFNGQLPNGWKSALGSGDLESPQSKIYSVKDSTSDSVEKEQVPGSRDFDALVEEEFNKSLEETPREGEKQIGKIDPESPFSFEKTMARRANYVKVQIEKAAQEAAYRDTQLSNIGSKPFIPELQNAFEDWVNQRAASRIEGKIKEWDAAKEFEFLDKKGIAGIVEYQKNKDAGNSNYAALTKFFDEKYKTLNEAGIDTFYKPEWSRRNYLPQLWNNTQDEVQAAFGKRLGLRPGFTLKSVFRDYEEGIARGLTPKYTKISQLAGWYEMRANKALADRKFFDFLGKGGFIQPESVAPQGWVSLNPDHFPLHKVKIEKFRLSATGPGNYHLDEFSVYEGTYKAPPNLAKAINNYLITPDGPLSQIARLTTVMKGTILASGIPGTGFNFHGFSVLGRTALAGENPLTATAKGLVYYASPSVAESSFMARADRAAFFARHGLTFSVEDHEMQKSIEPIFKNKTYVSLSAKARPAIQFLHRWFSDPLFQKIIPTLKLNKAEEIYNSLIKAGFKEPQAARIASSQANEFFGGLNLDSLMRSKETQNMFRATVFAPDFQEGGLRIGRGMVEGIMNPKNPEYHAYRVFARNLLAAYIIYNIWNKSVTGHYAFQNDVGHQFDIPIGHSADGKIRYIRPAASAIDFLSIPIQAGELIWNGDMKGFFQILRNRLSVPLGTLDTLTTGKDALERDIYDPTASGLSNFASAGAQIAGMGLPQPGMASIGYLRGQLDAEEGLSQALGFPLRFAKNTAADNNLSSLEYDQRPKLESRIKDLYLAGKSDEGYKLMSDYNSSLMKNAAQAYSSRNMPVPSSAELMKSLSKYFIRPPSEKVLENRIQNKGKGIFQRLSGQ